MVIKKNWGGSVRKGTEQRIPLGKGQSTWKLLERKTAEHMVVRQGNKVKGEETGKPKTARDMWNLHVMLKDPKSSPRGGRETGKDFKARHGHIDLFVFQKPPWLWLRVRSRGSLGAAWKQGESWGL